MKKLFMFVLIAVLSLSGVSRVYADSFMSQGNLDSVLSQLDGWGVDSDSISQVKDILSPSVVEDSVVECKDGDLFSIITGQPCEGIDVAPACQVGDIFSTLTGLPCPPRNSIPIIDTAPILSEPPMTITNKAPIITPPSKVNNSTSCSTSYCVPNASA